MNWIKYLLEANLYLALFYIVYYLLLRRDTYYQLNRIYLLVSSLMAFMIPLLQIGILKPVHIAAQSMPLNTAYIIPLTPVVNMNNTVPTPVVSVNYYLVFYLLVALVLTIAFGVRLYQLVKLARKGRYTSSSNFNMIEIDDEEHAFSFFNYLFIGKHLSASPTIIQHELVHIRQKHSIDIVYLELLKIICWFNPMVYLLQNSMKEVHEFIADSHIAHQDVNSYTDFLVSNAYGLPETNLTNNFFNKNLLKTRIMMLHQKRSGSLARLKYLVALPLLAGMLCLSTLGFTKNYGIVDLAPADTGIKLPPPPPVPAPPLVRPNAHNIPLPPPPVPPKMNTTDKGYKFREDAYLVNGKADFRVVITEKDGNEKAFFRNKATSADLKLLSGKYGYIFPNIHIYDKLPPPPPAQGAPTPGTPANISIAPLPPAPGAPTPGAPAHTEINLSPPPPAPGAPTPGAPAHTEINLPPPPANTMQINDITNKDYPFLSFYQYVVKHVRYPAAARDNRIQGKVFVTFNVNDDRSITNVFINRGVSDEINNEVIRVIKAYKANPDFKTDINYTMPVFLGINGDDGKNIAPNGHNTPQLFKDIAANSTYKATGFKEVHLNEVVVISYAAKK